MQNEHVMQQEALHLNLNQCLLSVVCSRPAVVSVTWLDSNCHLYDCWPLAGRDEKVVVHPLLLLNCFLPMVFQAGFSDLESRLNDLFFLPFIRVVPTFVL